MYDIEAIAFEMASPSTLKASRLLPPKEEETLARSTLKDSEVHDNEPSIDAVEVSF
jgi:hypothetical protein